jgi:hypothetical protein
MDQLKCIPNFKNPDFPLYQSFFKAFSVLNRGLNLSDAHFQDISDVIQDIITNECYMKNIDKYHFIQNVDIDEIVIPKLIPKLNKLENVIDYISADNTIEYKLSNK